MRAVLVTVLLIAPGSVWRDVHTHLSVSHPAWLHVTTLELTGYTNPVERVALYSGRSPNAAVQPRRDQVIAIVMEQLSPELAVFPRRSRQFQIHRLGRLEGFSGRWGEITFRDHGRAFYIFVGVGPGADAQLSSVLAALDSLRVGAA
jgi:hypothetical protein